MAKPRLADLVTMHQSECQSFLYMALVMQAAHWKEEAGHGVTLITASSSGFMWVEVDDERDEHLRSFLWS